MYSVISSYGVSKKPQSRWGIIDLTGLTVNEIFNAYREVYLTLTANFLTEPVIVNLEVFRLKYSCSTGTLDEMFADNGTATFELVDKLPLKNTGFAHYADAFASGYNIHVKGRNTPVGANISQSEKVDLAMTRQDPVTNMQVVYENCLVNVNGFYHITDTDGKRLYVIDGGKSSGLSKRNAIGLLSFQDIGPIQCLPITEEMIYTQAPESHLMDKVYLKAPVSTENKAVILVLGGYLVLPEPGVFHPIGNDSFSLSLNRLPLLERYFESLKYIDMTPLGLPSSPNNSTAVGVDQFYSDEVMVKYLTLSQSFFVIVDTPELFINKKYVQKTGLPGIYTDTVEPNYPLIMGRGRVGNYLFELHDGVYRLVVNDPYLARHVFNDLPQMTRNMVGSSYPTVDGNIQSRAYMLEIGSDFVAA